MTNQVTTKPKFSVMLQTDGIQKLINNTLGDKDRAQRFVASISSAVAVNPALQECEVNTIITGALLGEALNLSPSPQLGQYYLVPYEDKKKGIKNAQFQLGYKGMIQLAIRSGQYKFIDVIEIKEGEYLGRDEFTGEFLIKFITNEQERRQKNTIGYMGCFELVNGFRKRLYMSKDDMEQHADRYSKAFSLADYRKLQAGQIPEKDMWKYSSFWYKNFDRMAFKTILRQLLSTWGVMSIEMQEAFTKDMAVLKENGDYVYVDSPQTEETTKEEPKETPTKEVKLEDLV